MSGTETTVSEQTTPGHAPASPLITFGDTRPLRGHGFGSSLAAFIANVTVEGADQVNAPAISAAVAKLLPINEEQKWPAADDGLSPGQHLLAALVELSATIQRERGLPIFGRSAILANTANSLGKGKETFKVVVPSVHPTTSAKSLIAAADVLNTLSLADHTDTATLDELQARIASVQDDLAPFAQAGTNAFRLVQAAVRQSIEVTGMPNAITLFGLGQNSVKLNSSISEHTSNIGVLLAQSKKATAQCLHFHGLPGATHIQVSNESDAIEAARQLGYPVVVKPLDREQGEGVFPAIRSENALRERFRAAARISPRILVERHVEGQDFRITVVHDRVVKIMHRKPGGVTGDGQHTISQLVSLARQEAEKDTRRAWKNRVSLVLDEEAHSILAEDGHNPDSVPAEGVFVPLRRKSNISVGGTYDVLDPATFHPENLQLAVRVARTIGLDIAGVDLIIPDPAKPWQAQDAIICEVNAQPQIGYRDTPHIFEDILRELIPGNGRIPVHLIVLAPGEEAPDSLHMLARKLRCNAFSDGKRTMVQGQGQSRLFTDSFAAAQALLIDRAVTGALLVMPITDVLTIGLPARYIDTVRIALPAISDDRVRSMVKHAEMLIQPHTRSLQHISCTDVAS